MAQSLRVQIVGDPRGYQRALGTAARETKSFGRALGGMTKTLGIAAVAGAGLAVVIGSKLAKAAVEEEASVSRLNAAFRNQKIAMTESSAAVQQLEMAGKKLGFADDETRGGLEKLIRSGKDYTESVQALGVVQDIARNKQISLTDAAGQYIRMQAGNARIGKEYGIVLDFMTAKQWAAKAAADGLTVSQEKGKYMTEQVTEKVKGQAQAFADTAAGGMARFHAALDDLQENLGKGLVPILGKAAGALAGFLDKLSAAHGLHAKLMVVWEGAEHAATAAFNAIKTALGNVDWNVLWADVKVSAAALVKQLHDALQNANWAEVGKAIGEGLRKTVHFANDFADTLTREFAQGAREVGWGQVARALADSILGSSLSDKLKTVLLGEYKLAFKIPIAVDKALAHVAISNAGDAWRDTPAWAQAYQKITAKAQATLTGASKAAADASLPLARTHGAAVGHAMSEGVAAGIRDSLWQVVQAVAAMVTAAFAEAGRQKHGSGDWQFTREAVGKQLALGISGGFIDHMQGFATAIVASINRVIARAAAAVRASSDLKTAFASLATAALQAFDDAAAGWVPPSLKKLQAMQAADATKAAEDAVTAASNALSTALAGGDPAAIEQAQADFAAAQRAYQEFLLGQQAEIEQKGHDQLTEDRRIRFESQLVQLQTYLGKHPGEHEKVQKQIIALLKRYHIPMQTAGQALAEALGAGFDVGIRPLLKNVLALAAALEKITGPVDTGGTAKAASGGGESANDTNSGGGKNKTIVINLDGKKVAEGVLPHVLKYGANNASIAY